jgi:hypothetical protein
MYVNLEIMVSDPPEFATETLEAAREIASLLDGLSPATDRS